MSLTLPENNVRNWYRYDVLFSIELLESYIDGVEKQADESIIRFEKEKQTHVLEEYPEEGYARIVDVHQGLDDESWDLKTIFGEYFPSLQRRSALLTVCGFFEHELDKLCLLYQKEKQFKLSLSDLKDKGIDRSTAYLEKVAGINAHKGSNEWNHIKKIQKIRNIIVHQDGKLHDHQGSLVNAAFTYIKEIEFLSGNTEVVLHKGFLKHVVDIYKKYFHKIGESIEEACKA